MGKRLKAKAYCWPNGLIEFAEASEVLPEGVIVFAAHEDMGLLVGRVRTRARHAYGGTLLIPGVPEADGPDHAALALVMFATRVFPKGSPMEAQMSDQGGRCGVDRELRRQVL